MKTILSALILGILIYAQAVKAQSVIFVDASSPCTANCDGLSWATAFSDLQDGLAAWQSGQEIWVARGVYHPGNSAFDSFEIPSGVKMLGGFAPGALSRSQRNLALDSTILSGNIGMPNIIEDNSVRILYFNNVGNDIWIDGFIIEDGYASVSNQVVAGSAAQIYGSSPAFANCIFRRNYSCALLCSSVDAINVEGNSSPFFLNCLVYDNRYCGCISFLRNAGEGTVGFINSTLYGESVFCMEWGGMEIANSIFWINDSIHSVTSEDPLFFVPGSAISANNSDLSMTWTGPGGNNFFQDPEFLNPASGDFHLALGSPLIDQGDTTFLPQDDCDVNNNGNTSESYPHDLASLLRVLGGGLNLGAYEFSSGALSETPRESDNGWEVSYANPVGQSLNLNLGVDQPGAYQLEIGLNDLQGRRVKSHSLPFSGKAGKVTFGMQGLAAGIYVLSMKEGKSGQWIHRSRLVKVD